ncbi:PH domain-containing protein [Halorientalis halophila]|uniref:PH domain-containing protein n=1 Tax=Halorientalis halophila TaxID=3108499 RepID=UPI00300842D9
MLASQDENAIDDEELLTGTGSGGVFASGYLRDRPLIEYLGESERVAFLLSNEKKGVRREADDGATAYTPGDGYRAILAVTDTRVLFVVGDGGADGDKSVAVPYTEIEDVKTRGGMLRNGLDVWTTEGVRWRFALRRSVDVEPAAEYVERAAVVWSRVESQLSHANRHLADVASHLEERDHEAARDAAGTARDHLEVAQRKAPELTTDRTDAVWERIHRAERRLDAAVMDVHVSRAEAHETTASDHWRQERYDDAYETYLQARSQYERALDVAREHDFPEQTEIRESADAVTRTLDRLSKSPLGRAETAYERAREVDDPKVTAERLERALERYQTALVLDWGSDDSRFAGDSDELRERVETIAGQVVTTRRSLADRHRVAGDHCLATNRPDAAIAAYEDARAEIEAALAVASELKPGLTPELEAARDALGDRIEAAESAAADGFEFVGDMSDGDRRTRGLSND